MMDDRQLIDSLLEMPMSELIAVLSKRGKGVEIEAEPKKKKLKGLGPLRMRENKRGGNEEEDGGWDSPDSQDDQQHINSSYS
jgi:hypothetical protein